jgi:dethiobiotin synthetase
MTRPATSVFVAGTDTGVGKTYVALRLIRGLVAQGLRVAAMKPVAAGAARTLLGLRNDDALQLAAAANVTAPYELVNPVCLELATSPHLAARAARVSIDIERLVDAYSQLAARSDVVVVEGAGGWLAPIGEATGEATGDAATMQDVAVALRLPVILVVGLRLGALSHALLTAAAIERSGLRLAGWVANPLLDALAAGFDAGGDYTRTLEARLAAPRLTP